MAVDRTERLLNLVLCLLGAPRPVDRGTVRTVVPGYGESASGEAFERMFERDKEELRGMGIPIETVTNVHGEVEGYHIDPDRYALPPVAFTPAELAVLGLAARAWDAAALGAAARSGVHKLGGSPAAAGIDPVTEVPAAPADSVVPALWDAVRTRTPLAFGYRRPGETTAAQRLLEPWGVIAYGGGWYVVGRDRDRGAVRAFRTSRIVGAVSAAGAPGSFEPEQVDLRGLVDTWDPRVGHQGSASARIRLAGPGGVRFRWREAVADADVVRVPYADEGALAVEVAALGADAELLEPATVRAQIMTGFQRVLARHTPPEGTA